MKRIILFSILLLNACSINTNSTTKVQSSKLNDNSIKESVKPTINPIIDKNNSSLISETNKGIESLNLSTIEVKLERESKEPIFNLKSYINSKGNGIIVYNKYFKKISNFKVLEKEDIYYTSENKDSIAIVELNVNEDGNGFLITDKVVTCTTKDSSCLYDYSSRKVFKINDFNIENDVTKNQFDSISIDSNGTGLGYIHNQLNDTIEYKAITRFNIDGISRILSSEKNKVKIKLDNKGNGFIFYFENIEDNDKKESILYVKKIESLVPEKSFIKVKTFKIDDFINIDEVNLSLDSTGNGYIYFVKDKLYINNIVSYTFSNQEEIFDLNSSINLQLNSNGTSISSYIDNINGIYSINYQIFSNNSFSNKVLVSTSKEYLNNNSICLNSNGDGFVYWLKNDKDIYIRYINKYNLWK